MIRMKQRKTLSRGWFMPPSLADTGQKNPKDCEKKRGEEEEEEEQQKKKQKTKRGREQERERKRFFNAQSTMMVMSG